MSWVHFAKRWRIIWPERLDSVNTKIGPVLEVKTCCLKGKHGVEIRMESINKDHSHSWVRISHGLNKSGHELEQQGPRRQRAGNLRNAVRRICVKLECKWFCKPIEGQSKTTETRFCQHIHKNNTHWGKNMDRCWTRRIVNLQLWSVEEINSSSSSWKTSTSRRWWSGSILENQRRSSETFPALSSLVWREMEEEHGRRRRRKQEKIPVLCWFVKSNLVPQSSSRSFRKQSYWSYSTRQCCYSERLLLPEHLSCRMCNQITFHHQCRIDTGRSNFEQ